MQPSFQINEELINILKIPNQLYTRYTLRRMLINKLTKLSPSTICITIQLQELINETNHIINLDRLLDIIINDYSYNTNRPNCHYYHYDQKPNYSLTTI